MMKQRRRMLMQAKQGVTMMGVAHDTSNSSPLLTRLGAAVGKSAVAGIGSTPQVSDFDSMPIYRDIRVCNLAANGTVNAYEGDPGFRRDGTNGDVMVEIPAFWYKITPGTLEEWWIADGPAEGFNKHPVCARGTPYADLAKFYVPAYETSAGYVSKSGAAPLVSITRAQARTGSAAKGAGWSQLDIAAVMAVNLLMYIEYASLDLQTAIGPGVSNAAAAINTGGSDSMAGHTGRAAGTADTVAMKWRHIENWWGNVWVWVDGLNMNHGASSAAYYWCLNPSHFADGTTTNYTAAGYGAPLGLAEAYIKTMGLNAAYPWFRMPTAVGGSATTYYCDGMWSGLSNAGWTVGAFGDRRGHGTIVGMSAWSVGETIANTAAVIGCRLIYLPQSA